MISRAGLYLKPHSHKSQRRDERQDELLQAGWTNTFRSLPSKQVTHSQTTHHETKGLSRLAVGASASE
jgi:hypothetical protein